MIARLCGLSSEQPSSEHSNLNLHFHALVIDGTCSCAPAELAPRFHPASKLDDCDIEELTRTLHRRVTRYLECKGRLPRESDVDDESSEPELLALITDRNSKPLIMPSR